MDDLIFKLERVVQTKGSEPLEDFEGPLDLILFLLSKNKIEIQDIPIALILDSIWRIWSSASRWIWRWPVSSSPWLPT